MRNLVICVLALSLAAGPAAAQMAGMGGMGGMGRGGGASGPGEVENDASSETRIGAHDHPGGVKPISQEKFDKAVAAMFARADLNHDGMVTLAELQSVIDARRQAIIRDRFRDIDTNHDGRIDLDEFIAWQQDMGSAAMSQCAGYAGQAQIVPESLGAELGSSETDRALAIAVEPLTALAITRANVHYRAGVTLDDLLAYENNRFNAADANHDGFLEEPEIETMAGPSRARAAMPMGGAEGRTGHRSPDGGWPRGGPADSGN